MIRNMAMAHFNGQTRGFIRESGSMENNMGKDFIPILKGSREEGFGLMVNERDG